MLNNSIAHLSRGSTNTLGNEMAFRCFPFAARSFHSRPRIGTTQFPQRFAPRAISLPHHPHIGVALSLRFITTPTTRQIKIFQDNLLIARKTRTEYRARASG